MTWKVIQQFNLPSSQVIAPIKATNDNKLFVYMQHCHRQQKCNNFYDEIWYFLLFLVLAFGCEWMDEDWGAVYEWCHIKLMKSETKLNNFRIFDYLIFWVTKNSSAVTELLNEPHPPRTIRVWHNKICRLPPRQIPCHSPLLQWSCKLHKKTL